jgi:subfamily B ATP-binding cassette protein MsbA
MFEQFKRIWPYVKEYKTQAILAFLCVIPLSLIKAGQAYLIKPIFDQGLSANSTFEQALQLAGLLLGMALLNYPFKFYHLYKMNMICEKVICKIRAEIFAKFQSLPVAYFAKEKSGNLISKAMQDTSVFAQSFKLSLDVAREPLTVAFLIGVAFYHDYQLTLAVFLIFPLFLALFNFTGKKVKNYSGQIQSHYAEMTHNVAEGIYGQKVIKAFNLQQYIQARFQKAQDAYLRMRKKITIVEENNHPLVETLGAIMFSVVVIFAHHRIANGHLTTGGFISFIGALAMIMDPIKRFSHANVHFNISRAAGDRLFEILAEKNEVNLGQTKIEHFQDSIEFRNVTFAYNEHDVLKNFNLVIKKGQRIGLVGLSGSGKSTLVSLLLRLYPVKSGEILVDGQNIQSYELKSLRELFALVSQDLFLFNDTVEENVMVGQVKSPQDLSQSLEISYAKEFVDKLPDGVQTMIGDRGVSLSGGQCQRLTIARAFLFNSDIFLFDEATSALDNESEKIVQAALDRVAGSKTVISVAHRLSTVQDYDKIVVMKEGVKIEEGTHHELMAKAGEYAKLYELSQKN